MSENLGRFSGTVIDRGPEYGFVALDDSNLEIFFHRELCDEIDFETIAIGDRIDFQIRESVKHPGKLSAGRITRDLGGKYHAPKPHHSRNVREKSKRLNKS